MKRIYSLMALLAAAAGFAGCSDNDEAMDNAQPDTTQGLVEVRAYTNAETRTTLDNEYNVLWSADDKFMIGGKEFILSSGEGTDEGIFTGENLDDGEYTAYYPSTYKGALWPDQKYAGADNISGAPMMATATVTDGEMSDLCFTNIGGVLRYTVKGSKTIKSINVKSSGLDITLDCGDGVALTAEGTVFNIALPEGSYSNATLSFLATDGLMAVKKAATFVVTRNTVSLATFETGDLNFMPSAYSPDGTTISFSGREAVVVDLGGDIGKVAIATENETMNEEDLFTYYWIVNTNSFYADGWYVPTAHELELFSKLFAENSKWVPAFESDEEGDINGRVWDINGYQLFLPAAGFGAINDEDDRTFRNTAGVYASKDNNGVCLYSLNFTETEAFFANNMQIGDDYGYSVRLFHRLEGNPALPTIDYNSPVGTYGMYYDQKAIVVNLEGKRYAMAAQNLGAASPRDFGSYYTIAEAKAAASAIGNGWRLPTDTELQALSETYSLAGGKSEWATQNGVPGWQISFDSGNTLFFPAAGFSLFTSNVQDEGKEGSYISQNDQYLLLTSSTTEIVRVASTDTYKGSVRLIRDLDLSSNDPAGTIGYLTDRMAIVVDLGSPYGKVAIALCNEGASNQYDATAKYTWEEAKNLQRNGWYLPSEGEYENFLKIFKNNGLNGLKDNPNIVYVKNEEKIIEGIEFTIGKNALYVPFTTYNNSDRLGSYSWTNSKRTSLTAPFCLSLHDNLAFYVEIPFGIDENSKLNVRLFHKL